MAKLISTNPAKNYEILGRVEISTETEIKNAVKKAHVAKETWKNLGVVGRVKLLRKLLEAIIKNKEELALLVTKEIGMPITQSRFDIGASAIAYLKWYLDNAQKYLSPEVVYDDKKTIHKVYYEPIGVAAVIVPWNFPVSNFIWGVGQNLIAGNTVVFKHSEECPLSGKIIQEIVDSCHLPDGVFNEIYGDGKIGDFLVHQDIDLICFTGSTKVGQYLYKIASDKFIKAVLELGGSAPGIIFEDAKVDEILESIYIARFTNSGQVCDGLKRLIVHKSRFDEVVEKLKKMLQLKKIGNPEDTSVDFGPLVAKRQLDLLQSQVLDAKQKGSKIVVGGKIPNDLRGPYYEPTIIINVTKQMRVWSEEVFGPVLPVMSFSTEKEAIDFANDTKDGLGSYIFTQDKKRSVRIADQMQSGMVSINNAYYLQPSTPFGGYKKSGVGREHGKYGFHDLTQIKAVSFEK